jgi:hypothetical protein
LDLPEHFLVPLDEVQPTQLYISAQKLAEVLRDLDAARPATIEPLPLKRLAGHVILTDGHTRAFAAFLCGVSEVPAYWDEDELDWEAYRICVQWCDAEGISSVKDLAGRVVGPRDYQRKWLDRCAEMHRELEAKRGRR